MDGWLAELDEAKSFRNIEAAEDDDDADDGLESAESGSELESNEDGDEGGDGDGDEDELGEGSSLGLLLRPVREARE